MSSSSSECDASPMAAPCARGTQSMLPRAMVAAVRTADSAAAAPGAAVAPGAVALASAGVVLGATEEALPSATAARRCSWADGTTMPHGDGVLPYRGARRPASSDGGSSEGGAEVAMILAEAEPRGRPPRASADASDLARAPNSTLCSATRRATLWNTLRASGIQPTASPTSEMVARPCIPFRSAEMSMAL